MSGESNLCRRVLADLACRVTSPPAGPSMQPTTVRRAFDRLLSLHDVPPTGAVYLDGESGGPSAAEFRASRLPERKVGYNSRNRDRMVAPIHTIPDTRWLAAEISDVAATLLLAPAQAKTDLALKLIVLIAMTPSNREDGEELISVGLSALFADLTQGLPTEHWAS